MQKATTPSKRALLIIYLTVGVIILAAATTYTLVNLISSKNPYAPSGKLILNDPLRDNSHKWQVTPPPHGCQFTNGAYHVLEQNDGILASCHSTLPVSNFTFEVQMQIIQGNCGGIVFRDAPSGGHAYLFNVCTSGPRAGYYMLANLELPSSTVLTTGTSTAIHTGLNQPNVLATVVNGSTFDLYINHQKVARVDDSTNSQGQLAVFVNGAGEIVFTNARVWEL